MESRGQPPTTAIPSQQGCACLRVNPGPAFPAPSPSLLPCCFLGNKKALLALCGAGLPLDKPHTWGEVISATAGVVHAITSVLPAKKRLEQELPLL